MSRNHTTRRLALATVVALVLAAAVVLLRGPSAPGSGAPAAKAGVEMVVRDALAGGTADGGAADHDADMGDADDSDAAAADDAPAWDVAAWTAEQEQEEAASLQRAYTIPEGARYEPEVTLVSVREGATLDEVNELLARIDAVATKSVTAEELASGVLRLELAEGADVEGAVNALAADEAIDVAQPNFVYYAQLGDEADFRALLDAEVLPGEEGLLAQGAGSAAEDPGASGDAADGGDVAAEQDAEPEPEPEQEPEPEPTTAPASDPDPASAETEPTLTPQDLADDLALLVNDPSSLPSADTSWGLASIHAFEAWTRARCEGSVGVAVFDWYPSYQHEDLVGTIVDVFDASQQDGADTYDETLFTGHGTHVAGIVGATANNGIGIAGVSYNANLLLANVFEDKTSTSEFLIRAFDHVSELADQYNVRIVNISVGGELTNPIGDTLLVRRINRAYEEGIVTVAAAGNAKPTVPVPYLEYPGDATNVVSVINLAQHSSGAVVRSETSNYNVPGQTGKNISAPGTGIYSTYTTGRPPYASVSGTSMAAPHVSGVLALEFAANPELTAREAISVLYATAIDLGDEGWDEGFGYGEVDAYSAVVAASDPGIVADIMGDDAFSLDIEAEMPTISGATRVPVGATAAYEVTAGSLRIKSGSECAELVGTTLRGLEPGRVVLSVADATGQERIAWSVDIYSLEGFWTIGSLQRPSLIMGVQANSVMDKAKLVMQDPNGSRSQAWRFDEQPDGSYALINAKTGKAAHVWGGSSASGAAVVQYAFDDRAWQHWYLEVDANNRISIFNGNSECALDIAGGKARKSAAVQQAGFEATDTQKWVLRKVNVDIGPLWEGVYRVSSGLNRRYVLEVAGSSKKNGANVRLRKSNKGKNQQWLFTYLGGGVYRVRPMSSTRVLTVRRGKVRAGTNVEQRAWSSKKWQTWKVVENEDGSYSIRRNGKKLALAANAKRAKNGTNVVQARLKPSAKAQKWWLTQY